MPPADLNARLAEVRAGRVAVLHVGPLHPARHVLAGRPKASFLDLPTNLRTDWIEKGFAIEKA
jgi:hypothetical protein